MLSLLNGTVVIKCEIFKVALSFQIN